MKMKEQKIHQFKIEGLNHSNEIREGATVIKINNLKKGRTWSEISNVLYAI